MAEKRDEGLDSVLRKRAEGVPVSPIRIRRNLATEATTDKGKVSREAEEIISSIFPHLPSRKESPTLEKLDAYLDQLLEEAVKPFYAKSEKASDIGRLGPKAVSLDFNSKVGNIRIDDHQNRLSITSQSNFSTVKGNACVFKGKWMYEVCLRTSGVMQLGWCTHKSKFHQEEGVGDSEDSYAYDGNRVKKWNVQVESYGELWAANDIIGCLIDLDQTTVSFVRNGRLLGVAFDRVRLGPGYAYFPAASLSFGDGVTYNFGATPLAYPIQGYRPVQKAPLEDCAKASLLLDCLLPLLPMLTDPESEKMMAASSKLDSYSHRANIKKAPFIICSHLFDKLSPTLASPFVVQDVLLNTMLNLSQPQAATGKQPNVSKMLDIMWTFLEEFEIKKYLHEMMERLSYMFQYKPIQPGFKDQLSILSLVLALLSHQPTRKYLISQELLDHSYSLPYFMMAKQPQDAVLSALMPVVCLQQRKKKDNVEGEKEEEEPLTEEEIKTKSDYEKQCQELRQQIGVVESIPLEIMKTLLIDSDATDSEPSSREIFARKLRLYLKAHCTVSGKYQVPTRVNQFFFHQLLRALKFHWDKYYAEHPQTTSCDEAFLPAHVFFSNEIDFFSLARVGGVVTHLDKTLSEDLKKAGLVKDTNPSALSNAEQQPSSSRPALQEMPTDKWLVQILDGVVLLYDIAVHKHLQRIATQIESSNEFSEAAKKVEEKINRCPSEKTDIYATLKQSHKILTDKASENMRIKTWVTSIAYNGEDRQKDIYWLFRVVLRTIDVANETGSLFSYLPELYIDACVNSYYALNSYFKPALVDQDAQQALLTQFARFLTLHFCDSRIVNVDVRDVITQTMMLFIVQKPTLTALESMEIEHQRNLVKSLLSTLDTKSWAHSNWILVRLWKGCGFGFRYIRPPHLLPPREKDHSELNRQNSLLQKPCPSPLFQGLVRSLLLEDEQQASAFLNSILNQLNWAFSEFIGNLQEVSQIIENSSEQKMIDSSQLKICGTCFDIAVGLLRTLEFVVCIAPEIVTDWARASAEALLNRVVQVLIQILNRITTRHSIFENVVKLDLPGLDNVDHFPVLAPVTGILVRLILQEDKVLQERVTSTLLSEPSFHLSSVEYLIQHDTAPAAAMLRGHRIYDFSFSFRKYDEVNEEEIQQVENLITSLRHAVEEYNPPQLSPSTTEAELCTICYANPATQVFKPCGHTSCRPCILQHLMNNKDCFFCKTEIASYNPLAKD